MSRRTTSLPHSAANAYSYPKLRPLDMQPHTQNGRSYLMLRDPLQLSDNMLLVPQPLAAVLAFCDGSYTARGMAHAFHAHYGFPIGAEMVEQLVAALDEAYLLDTPRMQAAYQEAREAYRSAAHRPSLLAGQGYPAHADELSKLLEGYREEARAQTGAASSNGASPNGHAAPDRLLARFGLLSPHIDYPRGGVVYAQVWEEAAAAIQEADLAVILGTDHYGGDPFTLTRQHYATPYGVLSTATGIVDRLAAVIGEEAAYHGELRHRSEHSLELVAVWLHHMRGRQAIDVVPILCGGFHEYFYPAAQDPMQNPTVQGVLDTLQQAAAGRNVVVIASGDLAHVGPAFGDDPLTDARREEVARADAELIHHMQQGDAADFLNAIRAVRDGNNVCGVAPIYLAMQLLGAAQGGLHGAPAGYASCPADAENTSAVTIGGMIFYPQG